MEQDAPTMSVSLEESEAPAVETPPPAAPVAEAAPVSPSANTEDAEPEGVVVATGEKYVPLAAVKAERERRKTAETNLSAKDQEIASLREKASKYDEAASYLQQAKPYIEKAKADLQRQNTPPETQGPLSPAEAEEYARDFDLYTADGKPDVTRAQRIAARHEKMSQRQAQQTVAPILQTEAQRTANALYQKYLNAPEVNGVKVDPRFLAEVWNIVPADMIAANPNVAETLYRTAIGNQMLAGHKPVQAPPPVVPTESVGTGAQKDKPLGDMSQRFQQASRMKAADFKTTRESYTPGVANSLE